MDVIEDYGIGRRYQAQSHSNFGGVNANACLVFDTILLRRQGLSKGHKNIFPKTWRFKFKGRQSLLKVPHVGVENVNHAKDAHQIFDNMPCNGVRIKNKQWCPRFQKVASVKADWLEDTWFISNNLKDIQGVNFVAGTLHFNRSLFRSTRIQRRKKMGLSLKSWMYKYKREH